MTQKLLIQVSPMHTGSQFLTSILKMHPEISDRITSHHLYHGEINDFQSRINGNLDSVMNENISENLRPLLQEFDWNKKFALFIVYAHELWSIPYILFNKDRYSLICSMRNPVRALHTAFMRDEFNISMMSCYLTVIYFIKQNENSFVVPIDKYANINADERIKKFAEGFRRATGLEITSEMEEYIADWEPVGNTELITARREMTKDEIRECKHRIKVSNVLGYLRDIGLEYDLSELEI